MNASTSAGFVPGPLSRSAMKWRWLSQCRNGGSIGGVVIIKKRKGGKFSVDAETFGDPLWGNRYCAGGGDFTMRGAALLSANGRREWNQKLTRRGHLLVMEEIEPAR